MYEPTELLLLAYSRMGGDSCIAGVTLPDFMWVRPVTESGRGLHLPGLELFDVIQASLRQESNSRFQPENRIIEPGSTLNVTERPASVDSILRLNGLACADPWILHSDSETLKPDYAAQACETLQLVFPENICWVVGRGQRGKPNVRAKFKFKNTIYNLVATDHLIEDLLKNEPKGDYPEHDLRLIDQIGYRFDGHEEYRLGFTVSLGKLHNGKHFKLVAGVVAVPQKKSKDIIDLLRDNELEFIDNRSKDGALWVIDKRGLDKILEALNSEGHYFMFKPGGGKATGGRAAWYLL